MHIAEQRHEFMVGFLDQFYSEWSVGCSSIKF